MLKSAVMSSLAIALALTASLLPMRTDQATAQSGSLHILVVEYDIVPAEIDRYLTAVKELGAASVKEPGFRQLSIAISQNDPNHVLLFEAWDNATTHTAHVTAVHLVSCNRHLILLRSLSRGPRDGREKPGFHPTRSVLECGGEYA